MEIIIKMNHDEPVKVNTDRIYGEQHPLPDWDPEKLRDEIQDLKLENDRLQKRNDLMEKVLHSIACDCFCDDCVLVDNNDCDKLSIKMDLARNTLRKLVDL